MKALYRQIALLFCLILFTNKVSGNGDAPSIETAFFKITHPNSQKVSYLFGTHHAFGKSFFDSLNNVKQALSASDMLIKENLNIPGHLTEDIINGRTNKTKWTRYLSKGDLQFVNSIFDSGKVDFSKMSPAELHAFLSRYHKERVCLAKEATDDYQSLDDYIASLAKGLNLKLTGLETSEEQIELINKDIEGMPPKVHKRRLSGLISQIRKKSSDNCAEISWYRNMVFDYKFSQPCQNALILTDRNNKWMVQLKRHLQTNSCFIAVGLSHLMFECGLIRQLREEGYTVTPVEVN